MIGSIEIWAAARLKRAAAFLLRQYFDELEEN